MNRSIPIYKAEADIKDKILAGASATYIAPIRLTDKKPDIDVSNLINQAFATSERKPLPEGLFYFENILATSNWNENDDIFDKEEMRAAVVTPLHKPLNVEHNDMEIIGHTIAAYPVDHQYNKIVFGENTATPDLYHVMAGDVIYEIWHDREYEQKISNIIQEIKDGKWSVSMECAFADFDFGVRTPDGRNFIVKRGEATAMMTRHLKVFGGSGEYEGNRIGRLFRKIMFSGKGITKTPANQYSIIFDDFSATADTVGYLHTGAKSVANNIILEKETDMAENTEKFEKKIDSLNAEVMNLTVAKASIEKDIAVANEREKAAQANVDRLTNENKTLSENLSTANSKIVDLEAKLAEAATEKEKMKKEKDDAEKAKAEAESKLETVTAETRVQSRVAELTSKLVDAKVEKADEIAKSFVEKHKDKSDEDYAELSELFVKASWKPSERRADKKKAAPQVNTKQATAALDDEDFDDTDEDVDTIESEDEDDDEAIAAASRAFASKIKLFKNLKKETK